jgi:hypothetical protein
MSKKLAITEQQEDSLRPTRSTGAKLGRIQRALQSYAAYDRYERTRLRAATHHWCGLMIWCRVGRTFRSHRTGLPLTDALKTTLLGMDCCAALGAFGNSVATDLRRSYGGMSIHGWIALTCESLKAVTSIRISGARDESRLRAVSQIWDCGGIVAQCALRARVDAGRAWHAKTGALEKSRQTDHLMVEGAGLFVAKGYAGKFVAIVFVHCSGFTVNRGDGECRKAFDLFCSTIWRDSHVRV